MVSAGPGMRRTVVTSGSMPPPSRTSRPELVRNIRLWVSGLGEGVETVLGGVRVGKESVRVTVVVRGCKSR